MIVCPLCHGSLVEENNSLRCRTCARSYGKSSAGFLDLTTDDAAYEKGATTHKYAEDQSSSRARLWTDFLKPLLSQRPFERVLDVGCGVGKIVTLARQDGVEAYGVDLPALTPFWSQAGNDPDYFSSCDAGLLPFSDHSFDVVWSLGVIEHIGTETGHCTLAANYLETRQQYVDEILRVTKQNGRIIIACPNKHFPVDIQHGPVDAMTPLSESVKIRSRIFERTGINVHRVTGRYHLASYSEVKALFCKDGRVCRFTPLPLKNYFAFARFQSGFLRNVSALAQSYVNKLPGFLLDTFLNPYVLVLIEKS